MFTLILGIIFGLLFAYFATLNTQGVTLRVADLALTNVPLYLIALGSLLIGFLISGLFNLLESISASFALRGKDSQIKHTEQQVQEISQKMHDLEIENAKLRGEKDVVLEDNNKTAYDADVKERRSIFGKLRHSLFGERRSLSSSY